MLEYKNLYKDNNQEQINPEDIITHLYHSISVLHTKTPSAPLSALEMSKKGLKMQGLLIELFQKKEKSAISHSLEMVLSFSADLNKNIPKELAVILSCNNALRSRYYDKKTPDDYCYFVKLLDPALSLDARSIESNSVLLWQKWYALLQKAYILITRDHNLVQSYEVIKECRKYYNIWSRLVLDEKNTMDESDIRAESIKIEILEAYILSELGRKNDALIIFYSVFCAEKIQECEWMSAYLYFLEIFGAENKSTAQCLDIFLKDLESNNLKNKYIELFYMIYESGDAFAKLIVRDLEVINLKWKFGTDSYAKDKSKLIQKWEKVYEEDPLVFYEEGVAKIFEQEGSLYNSQEKSFSSYYDAIEHYKTGKDTMQYHIDILCIKNIAKNYDWIVSHYKGIKEEYNLIYESAEGYIKNTFFNAWVELQDMHERNLMNYIDIFQKEVHKFELDESLNVREKIQEALRKICKLNSNTSFFDPLIKDVFFILICMYQEISFNKDQLKIKFNRELKRHINKRTKSDVENQSKIYKSSDTESFFYNLSKNFQINNAVIINKNYQWQEPFTDNTPKLDLLQKSSSFSKIIKNVLEEKKVQVLRNYSIDSSEIVRQLIIIPFQISEISDSLNVLVVFRNNNQLPLSGMEIEILKENFSSDSIMKQRGNAIALMDDLVIKNLEPCYIQRGDTAFEEADKVFNTVFQKDYGAERSIHTDDCIALRCFGKIIAVAVIEPLIEKKSLPDICLDYDSNKKTEKDIARNKAQICIQEFSDRIVELGSFSVLEQFRLKGGASRALLQYALHVIQEYKIDGKPLLYFIAVANKIMLQMAKEMNIPIEYESGEIDVFNTKFKKDLLAIGFDEGTANQFIGSYAKRFPPHILLMPVSELSKIIKT
jgi:hypothetical protein